MEFLINITIKSTFILLFSGVLLWALKNGTATLRHWVISLTMIGLLILPLLAGIIPDISVTIPYLPIKEQSVESIAARTREIPQEIINDNLESPNNISFVLKEKMDDYQVVVNEKIDNEEVVRSETSMPIQKTKAISLEEILLTIWLVGGLLFLLKLIIGRVLIRNITINSELFVLTEDLRNYVLSITKTEVRFLMSHAIKTPMTWRGFKPVVLLPLEAKLWSAMELKTVLLHELNHIKRNDYWLHTLGLITVCLYWYHPLIWMMKKRQLLEREKACDEAVLRAGIPQQNYAEQLVHIARQLSGRSAIISEAALPMAKVSQTKARILAILKFDQQKFNFSKWKQWNWGLFYTFLFPVLAAFSPVGEIIQAHFELPKLESITRTILIPQNESINISTDLFSKTKKQLSLIEEKYATEEEIINNQLTNNKITTLETLKKRESLLSIPSQEASINVPQRPQKTGLFGKWKIGKSEFKIWTYGEFKIISTAPYIEVISPDGMVVIEEYKDGLFVDNVHELTLTNAPYDGTYMWDYRNKIPIAELPIFTKGTPIQFWSENRNLKGWLADNKDKIIAELAKKEFLKKVTATNTEWWDRIQDRKEWTGYRFIAKEKIDAKLERRRRRAELKLGTIPYKKLDCLNPKSQTTIIGRTALSGKDVGNNLLRKSLSPKGTEYMTVLKGNDKPALVKDFNFHLSKNDFENLAFELQLYNVVDGEIKYTITKSPIPITVERGNGWIKKDLSSYGIVTQGDVLVVLENKDFSGAKNGKGLYFSLADNHEAYQHLVSANFEWKTKRILERAFVMNLKVVEGINKSSAEVTPTPNSNPSDLTVDKIIETAINKLSENYIQKPYNADLFYRYSSSPNHSDSLDYQSEAVLKYYDSEGYQKRGWRKVAASRYAKLEQGRITKGEQKEQMVLEELGRMFFSWTHEPIITYDKPLSLRSMNAYKYKLIGTKKFRGKTVFEISFVCTKLKNRFAGLPSLKYMNGKIYINKEDYAILRYEQAYLMDYEYSGKPEKKRGHLKERRIIEGVSVEIFLKNEAGYYLAHSKRTDKLESQHTHLDGKKEILKGTYIDEHQYTNVTTKNIKLLKENLLKFNKETIYNPGFWKQFTIDLNK